jgi:HEAT repeat protein
VSLIALLAGPQAFAQRQSIDQLIAATNSPDEATQLKAIEALGTSRDAAAVGALEKLLTSKSPVVRGYAAQALGRIGPPAKNAAQGLIGLLADSNDSVRRHAIGALAAIRPGPKVTIPIFVKLMQDSDAGVRMRVMQAVADAKGAAVPALVEALKNDAAAYWACLILRDIGPDAVAAAPALVEKLKDRKPEIRREAVLALAAIGAKDAVPRIVPLLNDEVSRDSATYALAALGNIPPDAESTIRANIDSKDPLTSTVSLWAIARMHPEDKELQRKAITQLVARLKDTDPFVRAASARALAMLPPNPEIAAPIFQKALADADETTTHYMLDAIAAQGAAAVPRLIKALQYQPLRGEVAQILGRIGPPAAPATAELAKLVGDEDPNVSIEAAHALANIGPGAKGGVPALAAALENPQSQARHAAAFALGNIGKDASAGVPALVKVIKGNDDSLSLLCAWAIVQIQGATPRTAAEVVPELVIGLESPLPPSRRMAAETLGALGKSAKTAAPQLQRAAKDEDERVREAATKALKAIAG